MNHYQLREEEPQCYHYPPDTPDVAELRIKLKKIHNQRQRKADPVLWFGDFCTVLVLLPVLLPVVIIAAIVHLIRRHHDTGTGI